MTNVCKVPRRRFPEFRDAGEWESAQLGDLIATLTPPKKIPTTDYLSEGQFPIIDQGQSDIAGWTNDPSSLVEANQPLIVFGDHTCALKLIRRSFAQGADGIKIIRGSKVADTAFLYQFLCFRPVVPEEYKRHFSILKTKVVAYPDRRSGEQQKIADCLTSLDELIAAQTQKLTALKVHKKGLMQQLFPVEGETVPRLRFPEFLDAGEWEEKEVGHIFNVTRGEVLSMTLVTDAKTDETPYPVFSSQTKNNGLAGFYSEFLYEDAITWTTDGANAGDVNYRQGKFYCTNVCGVLINDNGYANQCVAALINSISRKYVSYVGNPKLMNGVMSKIVVPFPSMEEQQKIADCLSSLDELIAAQAQKLAAIKDHKKGLMQQLFPSLDEMPA